MSQLLLALMLLAGIALGVAVEWSDEIWRDVQEWRDRRVTRKRYTRKR